MLTNDQLLSAQISEHFKARPHVRPLGDNIVVLPEYPEREESTLGGIRMNLRTSEGGVAIPDIVDLEHVAAEVCALGDGYLDVCPTCYPNGKKHVFEVALGDKVLYAPWQGVSIIINDITFEVISERDILGTFPREETATPSTLRSAV